jgi:hypothetical protein
MNTHTVEHCEYPYARQPDHVLTPHRCEALEGWIRFHLNIFAVLQQLDVLPARKFLPDLMFFIPCSSTSLIRAPPPPASLTPAEIAKWVGNLALNASPLFAVYACQQVFSIVRGNLRHYFRSRLPTPTTQSYGAAIRDARSARDPRSPPPAPQAVQSTTPPQSPAPPADPALAGQSELNAGGFPNTSQMRPRDEPPDQPEPIPLGSLGEGAPAPSDPISPRRARRQSTISTRGLTGGFVGVDSYGSDDEDNSGDMVSTTLISFDVEATDATDPPPGQWSAELRPNVAEGSRLDGATQSRPTRQPSYRSTALTRLPSTLAVHIFAWLTTDILSAPVEAVAFRWSLRSFAGAQGLSLGRMYPLWSWGWSRHMIANFIGVELVQFFIQFDVWVAMYALASNFFFTEEQWNYIDGTGTDWIED